MRSKGIDLSKPIMATFPELAQALSGLHHWEKRHVDTLHDVWKALAPTPDSIVRNPKGYDPRYHQQGNHVRRIISPPDLVKWIQDVSAARGMPLDARQALNMAEGKADYALDMHDRPILFQVGKKA